MPVQFCSGFSKKMEGKSRVCRNLFGSPNHEELRKDLDQQLLEMNNLTSLHMKKTWNYDPDIDGCLDGRYDWIVVPEDEYVPAFYRKTYRPTKFRSKRKQVQVSSHLETPPSSPSCASPVAVLARLQGSVTNDEDQIAEDIENMRRENESTPEARIVPVKQTKIGGKEIIYNRVNSVVC